MPVTRGPCTERREAPTHRDYLSRCDRDVRWSSSLTVSFARIHIAMDVDDSLLGLLVFFFFFFFFFFFEVRSNFQFHDLDRSANRFLEFRKLENRR